MRYFSNTPLVDRTTLPEYTTYQTKVAAVVAARNASPFVEADYTTALDECITAEKALGAAEDAANRTAIQNAAP
jgi:hypothetical protein